MRLTPRFHKKSCEIMKIHDFQLKVIDFHGKSMRNHGFSRVPKDSWEICDSGCRSHAPPKVLCRPLGEEPRVLRYIVG